MRTLLIRPPFQQPRGFPLVPDVGLLYVGQALRRASLEATVHDGWLAAVHPLPPLRTLLGDGPLCVGIKLLSTDIERVRRLTREIKDANPRAVVVVGGPHPSAVKEALWEELPEVDYGIAGEGEPALPRLVAALADGARSAALAEAPGLLWRRDHRPQANPTVVVENLDELDRPAWDAAAVELYKRHPTPIRKKPHLPILTSRGCPFACSFCAGHLVMGRRLRRRSPARLMAEIRHLRENYGIGIVSINDDNFAVDRSHVEGFCQALLAEKIPVRWDCFSAGLRLDALDEPLVRLMERAGCFGAAVPLESGSQRVLDHMQKNASLAEMIDKLAMIRRATRLRLAVMFILGYPAETEADRRATLRLARRCPADHIQLLMFSPSPGASITAQLIAEQRLPTREWGVYRYDRANVPLPDISPRRLKALQIRGTLAFYLSRPRRLATLLTDLWSWRVLLDAGQRLRSLLRRG